jgi:hypothetical protein
VPLRATPLADEPIFMLAPANGRLLELRYGPLPADWASCALSLAALALCAALAWRPVRIARADRKVAWTLCAVVAVGVALAGARLARAASEPSWSLSRALDTATVELVQGGEATPCARDGDRHRCSAKSWNWVGKTRVRIGGVLRDCVWAHPVAGQRLVIRVPRVDVPAGAEIIVHHGLADAAVDANRAGAPVRLDVAGLAYDVRPNRKGWAELRVAPESPGPRDLEIAVTADRDGGRHYCLEVEVRK